MRRPFRIGALTFVRWAIIAAVWGVAVVVRSAAAQDSSAATTRSTLTGVYSAAQATAGQDIFESTCLGGCHNAASHKGMAFEQHWKGHSVSELFKIIYEKMPDDNPGALSAEQSAQVVAYMLKMNGLPAGKEDLPVDIEALSKIKIELPPAKTLPRPLTPNQTQ
jgi:mono/diheme cytochrome c family protein